MQGVLQWCFLHACGKAFSEAHARARTSIVWKNFLDHHASFPVRVLVATTAAMATGVLADGVTISCQVSANSETKQILISQIFMPVLVSLSCAIGLWLCYRIFIA